MTNFEETLRELATDGIGKSVGMNDETAALVADVLAAMRNWKDTYHDPVPPETMEERQRRRMLVYREMFKSLSILDEHTKGAT